MYNATTNMGDLTDFQYSAWSDLPTYDLTVSLLPRFNGIVSTDVSASSSPIGSSCKFYDATYSASTIYANNTQTTTTSITSYNYLLSSGNCSTQYTCTLSNDTVGETNASLPSYAIHAISSRAIVEAFVYVLEGSLEFSPQTGQMLSAGNTTTAYWTPLFTLNETTTPWSFGLTAPSFNLSERLTELFANVTLAFISISTDISSVPDRSQVNSTSSAASSLSPGTTTANISIQPTYSIYVYASWKLFLIYGIIILLVVMGAAYGIWSMKKNGGSSTSGFAAIVEALSGSELNEQAYRVKERKDLRLQYGPVDDVGAASGLEDVEVNGDYEGDGLFGNSARARRKKAFRVV